MSSPPSPPRPDLHWRANRRWVATLLGVWFAVTFGVAFFARDLQGVFYGWPFAFWVAAQGAPLVYVLIVGLYAWRMRGLDKRYGVAERDE